MNGNAWPFLPVNEGLNGAEPDFRFVLESGHSECTHWDRGDVRFWSKADIRTGSKSLTVNVCFGEKSGRSGCRCKSTMLVESGVRATV